MIFFFYIVTKPVQANIVCALFFNLPFINEKSSVGLLFGGHFKGPNCDDWRLYIYIYIYFLLKSRVICWCDGAVTVTHHDSESIFQLNMADVEECL